MKKTTDNQKLLRGTAQPCRLDGQVVANALVEIPKVKLKGTAKKIFEYTSLELISLGVLETVSVDLLVAYAREMALYHDLTMELDKAQDYIIDVVTKFGIQKQVNPKRKIAESALSNAKTIANEFGFTPISKNRLSGLITPKKNTDDFDEFEEIKI